MTEVICKGPACSVMDRAETGGGFAMEPLVGEVVGAMEET